MPSEALTQRALGPHVVGFGSTLKGDEAVHGSGLSRFVGRADELARLLEVSREVQSGRMLVHVVHGDAGVGKTRLLHEAIDRLEGEFTVLVGAAIDIAEKPSFGPILDALGGLLRHSEADWIRDLLAPWEAQLGVSPAGAPGIAPVGTADDATSDHLGVSLLSQMLVSLTRRGPVVLVIEDLQWADRSTRDLLVYLLANVVDAPLLVLMTYRADSIGKDHPLRLLLPELRRHRRVRFMDLRPLARPDLSELVSTSPVGGSDLSLDQLVWDRSEGNPFLAEETLRAAAEGQVDSVPQTLREIVMGRIAHLSRETRAVLGAVAVGEGSIDHRLLSAVVDLPEGLLLESLREAVDAAVLSVDPDTDGYRFVHGLIKDVLFWELLPGERRRLHRRYGESIAGSTSRADPRRTTLMAHHFDKAGDPVRALQMAVEAASDAEKVHGRAEAFEHWKMALRLEAEVRESAPSGPEAVATAKRASLLDRAAEAAHLAGEHQQAVELIAQRIGEIPEPVGIHGEALGLDGAALNQSLGVYLMASGRGAESLAAHQRAVALLPSGCDPLRAAVVVGGYADALVVTGRHSAGRVEAQRALTWARQAGAESEQSQILATLGFALACLEDSEAGLDSLRQGRRIAELTRNPHDIGRSILHLAELLAGPLNELEQAVEVATSGVEQMSQLGLHRTYGVALQSIASNALFRLGDWDQAAVFLADALAARPTGAQAIELRLARARLLVGRGDFEPAQEELEAIDLLCAEAAGPRYRIPLVTLRAGLHMWLGDPFRARRDVVTALEALGADTDDLWILAPLIWHGLRAVAESAEMSAGSRNSGLGVVDRDEEVVVVLQRRIGDLGRSAAAKSPAGLGAIAAYQELCRGESNRARGVHDAEVWGSAARQWDALRHPYPAAYARFRQAEAMFSARATASGAASILREAHRIASDMGAVPFKGQIEALARRARVGLDESRLVDARTASGSEVGSGASPKTPGPLSSAVRRITLGPSEGDEGSSSRPNPGPSRPNAGSEPNRGRNPLFEHLTSRELGVLAELAQGLSNREIGERLFISEKTVSVHVSHILAKLGLRSRVQAGSLYHRTQHQTLSDN